MKGRETIEDILTNREIKTLKKNPNIVGFTIGNNYLITCDEIEKAEVIFDIEFFQMILKETKNIYETLILAADSFLKMYKEKVSDGGTTAFDDILLKVLNKNRNFYKEAWRKYFKE